MDKELQQLSAEQAADLAALQADVGDMAPPLLPGESAEPAGPDEAEQWAVLPAMIGAALQMALPDLAKVYTPDACRNWGAAMVPVASKYGWNSDALAGPEIGLAVASFPLIIGTAAAIRAHRESIQAAAREPRSVPAPVEAQEAGEAPGAKAVQFGTVSA